MAKPHEKHIEMMNAFDSAERNTKMPNNNGHQSYGMGAGGLPRSPQQMQAVKKAATASASARGLRAKTSTVMGRVPNPPSTPKPGVATGGLAIADVKPAPKNKGLLSL